MRKKEICGKINGNKKKETKFTATTGTNTEGTNIKTQINLLTIGLTNVARVLVKLLKPRPFSSNFLQRPSYH